MMPHRGETVENGATVLEVKTVPDDPNGLAYVLCMTSPALATDVPVYAIWQFHWESGKTTNGLYFNTLTDAHIAWRPQAAE